MAASALALCLIASSLAACGSGGGGGSTSATRALSTPLATSLPSAGGSWALLPAGASSGEERFWELLHRDAGSSHWSQATPPGVQDNGGLAIAAAGRTLLAGFLPSYYLHFSPLALTADGGATWTPELLPSALTSVPDSLALNPDGTAYALLARGGGEVLQGSTTGGSENIRSTTPGGGENAQGNTPSSGENTRGSTPGDGEKAQSATPGGGEWRALTAARALATLPVAHGCGLTSIDAIADISPLGVLVGGACTEVGQIGEYAYAHGRWRVAAPPTPAALRGDRARVISLASSDATTLTLVDFTAASQNTLLAAWSSDGGRHWTESPPLVMGAREALIAAGPAPHGQTFLLVHTPHGSRVRIGAPTVPWRATPRPPEGTATVAVGGNGEIDALAVRGYDIVDWRLLGTPAVWHRVGTLHVSMSTASHRA